MIHMVMCKITLHNGTEALHKVHKHVFLVKERANCAYRGNGAFCVIKQKRLWIEKNQK